MQHHSERKDKGKAQPNEKSEDRTNSRIDVWSIRVSKSDKRNSRDKQKDRIYEQKNFKFWIGIRFRKCESLIAG